MTSQTEKSSKPVSEMLFEKFLFDRRVPFEPIAVADSRRPDYRVGDGTTWGPVIFEVKEISEDENFPREPFKLSTRIVGDHIRSKITEAK